MTEEKLKEAILELLFDLHARNMLNLYIINCITVRFQINAEDMCDANGLTYIIE